MPSDDHIAKKRGGYGDVMSFGEGGVSSGIFPDYVGNFIPVGTSDSEGSFVPETPPLTPVEDGEKKYMAPEEMVKKLKLDLMGFDQAALKTKNVELDQGIWRLKKDVHPGEEYMDRLEGKRALVIEQEKNLRDLEKALDEEAGVKGRSAELQKARLEVVWHQIHQQQDKLKVSKDQLDEWLLCHHPDMYDGDHQKELDRINAERREIIYKLRKLQWEEKVDVGFDGFAKKRKTFFGI